MTTLTTPNNKYTYTAIHLNMRSPPSKHDQLQTIISNLRDMDLTIDFIMVCETYLTNINKDMFPLDGYNFVNNNIIRGKGGGVTPYIKDLPLSST